ncbi:MAG: right-handed parallel beta-helix repeat-containing protein, partial [bacterium]
MGARRSLPASLAVALLALGLSLSRDAHATDHSGNCSGTWAAAANPHVVVGSCTVPAGLTLTIESGAIVQPQSGLAAVSVSSTGTLSVDGATFSSVYISSSGAITIGNSSLTAGSSQSVISQSGGSLSLLGNTITSSNGYRAIIASGSTTGTISGNTFQLSAGAPGIDISGTASPAISNNILNVSASGAPITLSTTANVSVTGNTLNLTAHTGTYGIDVSAGSPTISGNLFQDNPARSHTYIRLDVGPTSTGSITGNTFQCSGSDVPFELAGSSWIAPINVSGNIYPTGTGAGTILSGTLTASTTLPTVFDTAPTSISSLSIGNGATLTLPTGTPVVISSSLSVNTGGSLVVPATAELRGPAGSYAGLAVSGSLQAQNATFTRIAVSGGGSITIGNSSLTSGPSQSVISQSGGSLSLLGNTITSSNGYRAIIASGSTTGT